MITKEDRKKLTDLVDEIKATFGWRWNELESHLDQYFTDEPEIKVDLSKVFEQLELAKEWTFRAKRELNREFDRLMAIAERDKDKFLA